MAQPDSTPPTPGLAAAAATPRDSRPSAEADPLSEIEVALADALDGTRDAAGPPPSEPEQSGSTVPIAAEARAAAAAPGPAPLTPGAEPLSDILDPGAPSPARPPETRLSWQSVQLTPRQESSSPPDEAETESPELAAPSPRPARDPWVVRASRRVRERVTASLARAARGRELLRAMPGRLRAGLARGARGVQRPPSHLRARKVMLILIALNDVLLAATIAMLLLSR